MKTNMQWASCGFLDFFTSFLWPSIVLINPMVDLQKQSYHPIFKEAYVTGFAGFHSHINLKQIQFSSYCTVDGRVTYLNFKFKTSASY